MVCTLKNVCVNVGMCVFENRDGEYTKNGHRQNEAAWGKKDTSFNKSTSFLQPPFRNTMPAICVFSLSHCLPRLRYMSSMFLQCSAIYSMSMQGNGGLNKTITVEFSLCFY